MKTYDHVYLSPHFDDASLSCGGAIHRQRREGEGVLVVTICAASPAPGAALSPMATRFHGAMGSPGDVVAARLGEDRDAIDILGAEVVWLDFKDSIYRGRPDEGVWYYTSTPAVFGPIHPDEAARADEIAAAIGETVSGGPQTTLYAPLGVGGHVDHQHVHRAAWTLHAAGWRVVFYEDYPYADPAYRLPFGEENTATLDATLASVQAVSLAPRLVRLSEADVQAKIDSVRAYRSQVPMLFGDEATMAARLRAFAMHYDNHQPAERYWVVEPA